MQLCCPVWTRVFIEGCTKLREFLQCKLKPDITQHSTSLTKKLGIYYQDGEGDELKIVEAIFLSLNLDCTQKRHPIILSTLNLHEFCKIFVEFISLLEIMIISGMFSDSGLL